MEANAVLHGVAIVVLVGIFGFIAYKAGFFKWAGDLIERAERWFSKHY